jgi:hypothetical protein
MTNPNTPSDRPDLTSQTESTQDTQAPHAQAVRPASAGETMEAYRAPAGSAPIGQVRSTGTCILLTIVTLGFYTWYWYYKTHEEMKQHTGQGIGGGIALLLAIFVGIAMPFISSSEVGNLYARRGQAKPVSAATGLWFLLLGWFFFVGGIVWFVKTNGALNNYWRSLGAR